MLNLHRLMPNYNPKTYAEFRREWVLDPSKEMIVESEIEIAYERYAKDEAITYLRANTQRQVSSLGWAQTNAPKAYAEYHANKKPNQTIREYFGELGMETLCSVENERELLIANFQLREFDI